MLCTGKLWKDIWKKEEIRCWIFWNCVGAF